MTKLYLGDSVYVEWQEPTFGCPRVKLTTNNGYHDDPRNVIYLDMETLEALVHFVARCKTPTQKDDT